MAKQTKQVTFRADEETVDLFEKLFLEQKSINPEITKPAFFTMMIADFENKQELKNENSVDLSLYVPKAEYQELERQLQTAIDNSSNGNDLDEIKAISERFFADLCAALFLDPKEATTEQVFAEIRSTQQRAIAALKEPEEIEVIDEAGEIITIKLTHIHIALLTETAKRLSTPENTVTISDILSDMYYRYEVQRFNEWFYPWVIKDSEFLEITGYTRKQLEAVCK